MARKMATLTQVFLHLSPCLFCHLSFTCLCLWSLVRRPPCSLRGPSIPPGTAGLSSHRAEGPPPGHSEAAAAGGGKHHHTECLSPSSRGRARLPGRGEVRTSPLETTWPCLPLPSRLVGASPESILFKMVRAHFRKASSTFSPVRALVSRNISSEGRRSGGQGLGQSPSSTLTLTSCFSFCSSNVPPLPSLLVVSLS